MVKGGILYRQSISLPKNNHKLLLILLNNIKIYKKRPYVPTSQ